MKPHRDAAALAASLSAAASAPLRLPERPVPVSANTSVATASDRPDPAPAKPARKQKAQPDTVGITLRPATTLLNCYTLAAADRTRKEGRVVSAQQIMLEVLERHAPKVSP